MSKILKKTRRTLPPDDDDDDDDNFTFRKHGLLGGLSSYKDNFPPMYVTTFQLCK